MIFDYTDSVAFLKECLVEKAKTNPSYSMRAFAKKLELSAGGLSLILSRKKRLSPERAAAIARAMDLPEAEAEYFVLLSQLGAAKSAAYRTQILEKLFAIRTSNGHQGGHDKTILSVDQFRLISEWYGLACLELITGVRTSSAWTSRTIAERLGITAAEADATIERLKRLALITETAPGVFTRNSATLAVSSEIPNEAIRSYYEAVHLRSQTSIRTQGPDAKAIGAQVFAFDPTDLSQIKKLTDDYLSALNKVATQGKNRTEIYQAVANVFRVSGRSQESASVTTTTGRTKTAFRSASKRDLNKRDEKRGTKKGEIGL